MGVTVEITVAIDCREIAVAYGRRKLRISGPFSRGGRGHRQRKLTESLSTASEASLPMLEGDEKVR